jgi:hypothetical protein
VQRFATQKTNVCYSSKQGCLGSQTKKTLEIKEDDVAIVAIAIYATVAIAAIATYATYATKVCD